MGQKILIALDGSEDASKIIKYLSHIIHDDDEITLYSVVPIISAACDMTDPSLTFFFNENKTAFCALEDEKKRLLRKIMEDIRATLHKTGILKETIHLKIETQEKNIAIQILDKAKKGDFQTIIIGKRGLSRIKELIMGSVSHKVVQLARDIAVIVIS